MISTNYIKTIDNAINKMKELNPEMQDGFVLLVYPEKIQIIEKSLNYWNSIKNNHFKVFIYRIKCLINWFLFDILGFNALNNPYNKKSLPYKNEKILVIDDIKKVNKLE